MALSKAQEKAILHYEGPAMVLAGPGSGKTTVITRRTVNLIRQYRVKASNILVVTFTRAAAEEMKKRFLTLMDQQTTNEIYSASSVSVRFGTFHSVFFQILKKAYGITGANILGEDKKYQYLKDIVSKMDIEIEDENDFLKSITTEISNVKSERINLEHYYSVSISDEIFRKIYTQYHNRLEEENLIDYDDILIYTWELFTQRPDILEQWRKQYPFILIDEFQDINLLQYDIIKMLAAPLNNLFIVGDDDQSIYRFRGAKPEIMLRFPKEYPNTVKILLDKNFRCPGNVVKAASNVIGRNITRYDKDLHEVKEMGEHIHYLPYKSQIEESVGIIKHVQDYRTKGYTFSQMAVLYRNNMDARIISQRFMEYNIPLRMRDLVPNLYDHWIARNMIQYMKAALGNRERSLILQIMNRPKRYISRECLDERIVDFERVRRYYDDKYWMIKKIDKFEHDLYLMKHMDPYKAICHIRHEIGYEDYLSEYADFRKIPVDDLLETLDLIQESAKGFATIEEWFSHIEEYTQLLKEQMNRTDFHDDAVTFSTLHSAKGLEFPIVFIIDVNEGIIPFKKALMTADIEEERRLFYVGMTRAQDILHICSINEKNGKSLKPSPFISGLKEWMH